MTYDVLVRFAAGKVGMEAQQVENSDEWFIIDYKAVDCQLVVSVYRLSSPELFLKGLEAFEKSGGDWVISKDEMALKVGDDEKDIPVPGFVKIADIPLTFWQCWFELEGGQG